MTVYLFDECDQGIGTVEWSHIPRVGDGIVLANPPEPFRVDDIFWEMGNGGREPIVKVRLRPFDSTAEVFDIITDKAD